MHSALPGTPLAQADARSTGLTAPRARPTDARPTRYREHVFDIIHDVLRSQPPTRRLLDFGAGDGWFTDRFVRSGLVAFATGVEVLVRPHVLVRPLAFDGSHLPFVDRAFDVTCAIDVLHHCGSPERALAEIARCTAQYILLKDHTYESVAGWWTLSALDEIGNRRFGVPSPRHYQCGWSWNAALQTHGFALTRLVHPAPCHTGLLGRLTNHLQFVALWQRAG